MDESTTPQVEPSNEPPAYDGVTHPVSEASRLRPDPNERYETTEFVPDGLDDEANVADDSDFAADEQIRSISDAGTAF
ncbi:MAG: hypothetical protein ABI577_03265 [bacterium]